MDSLREKHDEMLFQMLTECKTIPNFFDQIFGFLSRRTDFYVVAENKDSAVGLPEGLAEKLVRHTFFKWKPKAAEVYYSQDIPTAVEETVVVDTVDDVPNNISVNESVEMCDDTSDFTTSEFFNGNRFNKYCWCQTITDIDITVKIAKEFSKKDLKVEILPSKISVKLADGTILLDGELYQKCKSNDAIWSLDNSKLFIHLDKCQEMWWTCLVKNEPPIEICKIDCSRPYEELSEEAQAKIQELQWNQEQKRLGLPTSDELVMHKTLEKAWHAEGSPFTGPFDPSTVKFN